MTTITFDTLKFANRLKEAGVSPQHAEAEATALAEVFEKNLEEVATKWDLKELKLELSAEIAPLKWGMAVSVAGMIALIIKAFFPH